MKTSDIVKKTSPLLLAVVFLVGCAGGRVYTTDVIDGQYYRVTDVGHNNIARKGLQYGKVEFCMENGQCKKVAEDVSVNGSLFEQLAGPAATVGAAKLLGDGIADSGDNVTNNNSATGGAGGDGGDGGNVTLSGNGQGGGLLTPPFGGGGGNGP